MQKLCLAHTSVDAGHCRTYRSGRDSWSAGICEGGTLLKQRVKTERHIES